MLRGEHQDFPLVLPGEDDHVTRSSSSDHSAGFLLPLGCDVLWETPAVGLDCSSDRDTNLGQLSGEERTGVEPIHIKVIPFVVERLDKGLHNTDRVWMIAIDELGLLAVVHTHPLEVARFTIREHKSLDPPGVWLSLQVLAKGDPSLEGNHRLIDSDLF